MPDAIVPVKILLVTLIFCNTIAFAYNVLCTITLPAPILPDTDRLANVPNAVIYGWLLVVRIEPELPVYVGNADITFE